MKSLLILCAALISLMSIPPAAAATDAEKLLALTGYGAFGEQANPMGSLVITSTGELAKRILQPVNGSDDDRIISAGEVIIIATGKTAEALLLLAREVGVSGIRTVQHAVIIAGESARVILDELYKTGLVAIRIFTETARNLFILGKSVIKHALRIIGNLMVTGLLVAADIALKGVEVVVALLGSLLLAPGYILTAAVSGTILLIHYGIKMLTQFVHFAERAAKFLITITASTVVGVVTILIDGVRYMLERSRQAIGRALQGIIQGEMQMGERAVAESRGIRDRALRKLIEDIRNFGKRKPGFPPAPPGGRPPEQRPFRPTPMGSDPQLAFQLQ